MNKDAIAKVPLITLVLARKRTHEMQAEIWDMLVNFTKDTGLVVSSIDVSHMETFVVGDPHKSYRDYEVQVNVVL